MRIRPIPILIKRAVALAGMVLAAGCAHYTPRPLPETADLRAAAPAVSAAALRKTVPGLAQHPFDATGVMDMTQVATVAVLFNPDLRAARAGEGVARAQAFAAGLLPDPQLSMSLDHYTGALPDVMDAYGVGINYDVGQFVTRGADIAAARAHALQVNLDVLWQEWQVIQKSRQSYIDLMTLKRKLRLLESVQKIYADRYRMSSAALKRGDLSLDVVGTDLTALLDINSRINTLRQQLDTARHDLDALLGLQPRVKLRLAPLAECRPMSKAEVNQAAGMISRRRPDLLALQAGYRSQEAKVRRAILAQFPSISLGVNNARDNTNIHSIGFGLTMTLPFINANRGEIAVQRATREQLRREYLARLDQTRSQVDLLVQKQRYIRDLRDELEHYLPGLKSMVIKARSAYRHGDISALSYINMENTLLQKRLERVDLNRDMCSARLMLDTLTAWPDQSSSEESSIPGSFSRRRQERQEMQSKESGKAGE